MPKTANYPKHLEREICQRMTNLVELLTTSGKPTLIPDIMKKFKRLCRTSDSYVEYAYELLFTQLMRDHAEIRLSAFQMIDELFNRSHAFRQSLLVDFQCFLELSVGTSLDRPLPPPKSIAQTLKTEACKAIHQWQAKFGEAYTQLALGYQFLKNCKKVDFDGIQARAEQERQQQEETQRKLEEARQLKLDRVLAEIQDSSGDIDLCIKEIESCLELLIPHPESFFIGESETLADAASNTDVEANTNVSGTEKPGVNLGTESVADLAEKDTESCSSCKAGQNISENTTCGVSVCKLHLNSNDTPCDGLNDKKKINSKHKHSNIDTNKRSACKPTEDSTVKNVSKTETMNPTNVVKGTDKTDEMNGISGEKQQHAADEQKWNEDTCKSHKVNEADENISEKQQTITYEQPSCSSTVNSDVEKSHTVDDTDENNKSKSEYVTDEEFQEFSDTDEKNNSESESEYETDEEFEEVGDRSWFTQDHGLFNRKFELSIEVGGESSRLRETEDNRDIIRGARDQYKLIKMKFLPNIKRWLQGLDKHGAKQEDIKRVENFKAQLEDAKKRCLELEIITENDTKRQGNDSDSDDDEFEEVAEKEGYEDHVPEHVRIEALRTAATNEKRKTTRGRRRGKNSQKWFMPDADKDPTTWQANVLKLSENIASSSSSSSAPPVAFKQQRKSTNDVHTSTSNASVKVNVKVEPPDDVSDGSTLGLSRQSSESRKQLLLDKAPVVPFGVDLEHWENPKDMEAPMKVNYEDLSRFWVREAGDGEPVACEDMASLTRRSTTFVGEFKPIKWKCRSPLPSGKLCERMDREKCPFHGKIIARDLTGQPNDPADSKHRPVDGANIKLEEVLPEDQDPDLQEAIQATLNSIVDPQPSGSEVKDKLEPLASEVKGKSEATGSRSEVKGKRKGKQKAAKRKHPNLTDITPPTKSSRDRLESKIFKKSTLSRVNSNLDAIDAKKVRDKFSNQFNYSLK